MTNESNNKTQETVDRMIHLLKNIRSRDHKVNPMSLNNDFAMWGKELNELYHHFNVLKEEREKAADNYATGVKNCVDEGISRIDVECQRRSAVSAND